VVMLGSQRLALPASEAGGRLAAYQGRKIIVGLRPEDLSVASDASSGPSWGSSWGSSSGSSWGSSWGSSSGSSWGSSSGWPASLVADVRMVEVLGSEQHVYFSLDATPVAPVGGSGEIAQEGILADSVPNGVARLDPRAGVRAGNRVTFAVNVGRMHFFDPDTGHAIG